MEAWSRFLTMKTIMDGIRIYFGGVMLNRWEQMDGIVF